MKKRTVIIVLVIVGIFMSGCVEWEKDVVLNGIRFEKFCRGNMMGYLAEDTIIQNYPCKKSFVVFYDDWSLDEFQVSKSFEFNDFVIPAKTWVSLDKDGNITICMFPRDIRVQGHLCRGSIMGRESIHTVFHKNKKLKCFFARKDVNIDSIPCKGSVFCPILLHDNGKLQSCTLAKTITVNGKTYQKGSKISLDKKGNVQK